jgi:hypothetical protein
LLICNWSAEGLTVTANFIQPLKEVPQHTPLGAWVIVVEQVGAVGHELKFTGTTVAVHTQVTLTTLQEALLTVLPQVI